MKQIELSHPADYAGWRRAARQLLLDDVPPEALVWNAGGVMQDLFSNSSGNTSASTATPSIGTSLTRGSAISTSLADTSSVVTPTASTPTEGARSASYPSVSTPSAGPPSIATPSKSPLHVPQEFLSMAEYAVCHRAPDRFALLYRVLWRVMRGERTLFNRDTDDDMHRLHELHKAVSRDRHKMTAFVRFRQVTGCQEEQYSAWFEPDHHILRLTSLFFKKRFTNMRWSIFTPEESAHWDGETMVFGEPGTRSSVPEGEEMEALWKTYFANIFNPARLRLDAMRAEMPMKYWKNLPEAPLIAKLTRDAGGRTQQMVTQLPTSAPRFAAKAVSAPAISAGATNSAGTAGTACTASTAQIINLSENRSQRSLAELGHRIRDCDLCPHACEATQAVMGQGPVAAKLMLIGEQPGDREDLRGRPFVGPAGQLLRSVLEELQIDVDSLYLTNAVKHFKFAVRGKRRLHQRPDVANIDACRGFLFEEIALVQPQIIVALGATAGRSLLQRSVHVERERGSLQAFTDQVQWMLSAHPAHVLRSRNKDEQAALRKRLKSDLKRAYCALRA